jgi:rSAM/selenodomain-associated transferase 1
MMPGTLLAMFAKYWQPGEVKTRLAPAIGAEAAAQLYRAFVKTLLEERQSEFAALLREAATPPVSPWAEGQEPWLLAPQSPGDLGERMKHLFRAALAAGADRVVLIGSDSPTLPLEHVQQAFDKLRRHEVVLGPSDDGGYALIGLSVGPGPHPGSALPPVFDGLPWSTPHVWPETIRRLEDHGSSYAVLPAWYDVDEPADLERLRLELHAAADESFQRLSQAVGEILCRPA